MHHSHRRTALMCHSEERSDVGISGRQLRFRRWFPCYPTMSCEIAPQGHFLALRAQGATSACGLLAMTNREPSHFIGSLCESAAYRREGTARPLQRPVRDGSAFPRLPRAQSALAMTNLWLSPFYRQPALVDSIAPGGDSPAPTTAVRQPRHFLLFFHKCPPVSTRRA